MSGSTFTDELFPGQRELEDGIAARRFMGLLEGSITHLSIDLRDRPEAFDAEIFARIDKAADKLKALVSLTKGGAE